MRKIREDQVELAKANGITPEQEYKREIAIANHNKLQTRWAITKNPITKAALAERLKQSWIALGGPMPEKEVVEQLETQPLELP